MAADRRGPARLARAVFAPPARTLRRFLNAEVQLALQALARQVSLLGAAPAPGFAAPAPAAGPHRLLRAVHQFHSGSAVGDAVTNAMVFTRSVLRDLGYRSEIHVEHRDPRLAGTLRLLDDLPRHADYVLLIHHSMGHGALPRLLALPAPKILIYHNITPPELIPDPALAEAARQGRADLGRLRGAVGTALAVSPFNALELRALGFDPVGVCPLLFDLAALRARAAAAPHARADPFTILFVGRLAAAKGQADLVDAFAAFARAFAAPCRLVLIGRTDPAEAAYGQEIAARITRHRLGATVLLPGLLTDEALHAWYARADLYVSLSRHEGVGLPLIEALAHGVPVIAWPAAGVPYTLAGAGRLLSAPTPEAAAAAMLDLARAPPAARPQAAAEAALAPFARAALLPELATALARAGAAPAVPPAARTALAAHLRLTLAGHVNGSYSLAAVNRDLARAIEAERPGMIRLLAVEGAPTDRLDGVPDSERPEIAALAARPAPPSRPEVVISQHYPPYLPDEAGDLALALVFWEESLLPPALVATLARGFRAVLAPSRATARALTDSGLPLPVAVIGHTPDLAAFAALERRGGGCFTFLHVSSGFPRKGTDVLLEAFAGAFRRPDPVRLVLKTFPNPHQRLAAEIAALRARHPDCPEIVLIDRDLAPPDLLALYEGADAMVLPTRGEGFNLPAAEAMAAGIPLIVTGAGGQRDFCGPAEARLLRHRLRPSRSHLASPHSLWAEPDRADLIAALREMRDPAFAPAIAARAAAARAAAARLADRAGFTARLVDTAARLLLAPPAAPLRLGWVSTFGVACGVAEYSRALLDAFAAGAPPGGFETIVFCDDRTSPADPPPGISRLRPSWWLGDPEAAASLALAIAGEDPELLVIQHQSGLMPWPVLSRLLADPRIAGRLVLATLHNPRDLLALGAAARTPVLAALAGAARIFVHTQADLDLLQDLGLEDNISYFPQGAPAPAPVIAPRPLAADAAAVIGCHGFFLPHKGIADLIAAAAQLRRRWPGLRLRLVNAEYPAAQSQAEIAACRALAQRLGVTDMIEWETGFLPAAGTRALLRGCDLLVLPYRETAESSSAALRAVLASGVPVALTRVSIFAEAGDAAAQLSAADPAAMARELGALLESAAARVALQEPARAWLAAHAWPSIAARLRGLIEGLVATARLPP